VKEFFLTSPSTFPDAIQAFATSTLKWMSYSLAHVWITWAFIIVVVLRISVHSMKPNHTRCLLFVTYRVLRINTNVSS